LRYSDDPRRTAPARRAARGIPKRTLGCAGGKPRTQRTGGGGVKANETTVALVARTVCAPDSLACIIVRPHQIVYRDRTWVVGSDGHRFLAIAVDDTPYCPDTPATIEGKVLNMIDP